MGRLFDSKQFRTDLQLSGSFSGSFIGDGSSLTNVPATGIVGLNLSQIGSGSATASISPDNGLHVNTSISASIISGSILVTAPTGSFEHIITTEDTIEFRNKSTGIPTGRLKFDSENGLNVQDSDGGRTRIRAGFGKFLQLESFTSFNSIGPLTASIISASSTIFANDIEAFRMNVTHLTSSFITASTIETSGSNIFGDESSDTHTFVGDIIAQNNISSSGYISGSVFSGDGSGLINIPASGITGLNLSQIASGSVTASIAPDKGLVINTNISASGYISASNFVGDGSSLTGVDSIYTANGNILETRTINDRDGGFTGTAGSNALKMNVRNSGALLVAGYQNNGNPGTTNHLIQWGPGTTAGGMNVRGKLGLTSGGGRIDLTNSGGSQYFTVAQTGITSTVTLSATTITNNSAVADTKLTGSFTGSFQGDGNGLTNISSISLNGISLGNSTIVGDGASSATSYGTVFGKSATSTGGQNIGIGAFSNVKQFGVSIGHSVEGGNNTVAIGYNAGHTSGENNVLVGYQPGTNTSGDYNISLGYLAGFDQTSGTGNITIGSGSRGVAAESNQLRIGHGLHGALISGSLSNGGVMIQGQVSASSYIGDGSGLTGIVTETNFTQSLFVSPSGNDSTAAVGDMMKPFATILGATGSANPGDTIIVYPGIYEPTSQIIKDHVNYYFYPGAIVSGSIPLLSGTFEELNVRGHGIFDTNFNGDTINITANGVFECDTVRFGGLQSAGYAGAPKFAQDYTNYPNRNLTISGKFKYGKPGARVGNALGGSGVSIGGGAIIANVDVHVSSSSTMPGIRLSSQYTDALINATVYANMGTALYSNQRISHTTIKGMYETGDQSTYYAIELSPGYVGNFFIDATMIGAIKLATGGVGQSGVDVRGFQSCTNSPSSLGAVQLSSAGYYTLHHRIEASENIFYQTNAYAYTTYTGNAQIMSDNTGKMFDIQGGRFIWKGSAGDKEVRVNQNTVSGGELIIDSPLIHYGSSYPSNRFCFNLTAGTLEINNKLIYHQNTTGSGIIDMSGGYLKLNGAQLIHADHTGSYAYAIDLNSEAHSGSIFNNSFTNLKPFGPGSFTNEIVGGGTLFESHKLY